MTDGEQGEPCFLVEWYGPAAIAGSVGDAAKRISAEGVHIRHLMTVAIPDDDYAFGIFAAESAATVEQVCTDAGAPPDRVSAAIGWPSTVDC
jgi:hypothetical protein